MAFLDEKGLERLWNNIEDRKIDWNDLDNKPFYVSKPIITELEDYHFEALSEENNCHWAEGELVVPDLVPGDKYIVTWDGTEYMCVAFNVFGTPENHGIGNCAVVGDTNDTGEPFFIMEFYDAYPDEWGIYAAESGSHTVKIEHVTEVIHTLDERFIPDSIARNDTLFSDKQVFSVNLNQNNMVKDSRNFTYIIPDCKMPAVPCLTGSLTVGGTTYPLPEDSWGYSGISPIYPNLYVCGQGTAGGVVQVGDAVDGAGNPTGGIQIVFMDMRNAGEFNLTLTLVSKVEIPESAIPDTIARTSQISDAPDWNQNNSDAYDYIKGRTHYDEVVIDTVLVPEAEFKFYITQTVTENSNKSGMSGDGAVAIRKLLKEQNVGKICYVLFDGVEYEAAVSYQGGYGLGNAYLYDKSCTNTGEPFYITSGAYEAIYCYISMSDSDTHTLSVYTKQNVVKQLDEKYIPDSIARVSDIPIGTITAPATAAVAQTIAVKAVDENGKPTEWEAVDRTHYTEDKSIEISFTQVGESAFEANTSPEIYYELLKECYNIAKYYVDGVEYNYLDTELNSGETRYVFRRSPEFGHATGWILFRDDHVDLHTNGYPVSAYIIIPQEEIHQLDEKYLPNTIARVSDVAIADWNQDDETAPDYVKNRTHYTKLEGNYIEVLAPTTILATDFAPRNERVASVALSNIVIPSPSIGAMYTVFYDDVPYVLAVGSTYGPPRCLGNQSYFRGEGNSDSGEPFFIWFNTDGNNTELWLLSSELHDITISIYGGEVTQTIKQLDEKYIPDTIARVSDIPKHQSDWSQSDETALDYIKNRTHYEVDEILFEHTFTNAENEGYERISYNLKLEEGRTYYLEVDGIEYESVVTKEFESGYLVYQFRTNDNKTIALGYEFYINGYVNGHYILKSKSIKKLDRKYIPDIERDEILYDLGYYQDNDNPNTIIYLLTNNVSVENIYKDYSLGKIIKAYDHREKEYYQLHYISSDKIIFTRFDGITMKSLVYNKGNVDHNGFHLFEKIIGSLQTENSLNFLTDEVTGQKYKLSVVNGTLTMTEVNS